VEQLCKREGTRKYNVDPDDLHLNQQQLLSSFVTAVKLHLEKRVGLAYGNGSLLPLFFSHMAAY